VPLQETFGANGSVVQNTEANTRTEAEILRLPRATSLCFHLADMGYLWRDSRLSSCADKAHVQKHEER
jgi:hypothetical protein